MTKWGCIQSLITKMHNYSKGPQIPQKVTKSHIELQKANRNNEKRKISQGTVYSQVGGDYYFSEIFHRRFCVFGVLFQIAAASHCF